MNVNLGGLNNAALVNSVVPGYDRAYRFANAATINFAAWESWTPAARVGRHLALTFTGPGKVNEKRHDHLHVHRHQQRPGDAAGTVLTEPLPAGAIFRPPASPRPRVSAVRSSSILVPAQRRFPSSGTLTFLSGGEGGP